jgi:ectoine hydroxylase
MLTRFLQRYKGFLRSIKPLYVLYNWFNARQLEHNRDLYPRFGLRKSIFSPIGHQDFSQHSTEVPWLDRPDALTRLEQHPDFASFNPTVQDKIRQFVTDGYMILEGHIPAAETETLSQTVDTLLTTGKVGYNFTGRKIFNLWQHDALANTAFFRRPDLLKLLSFLLGKQVIPFQSLNFVQGSEQRAHSDSIHMTTEPEGYLIATWTALEDCIPGSGLLYYYPGSHRLPYLMTADYDSGNTAITIGAESNKRYEQAIAQLIEANNLQPRVFEARRGDVLIWHANLIHGGSPITRPGATRRSMVCHYFAEEVICYHEMSQRPALIPERR